MARIPFGSRGRRLPASRVCLTSFRAPPALVLRRDARVLDNPGELRDVGAEAGVEFVRRAADRLVARRS
jgi:hypothetical protein